MGAFRKINTVVGHLKCQNPSIISHFVDTGKDRRTIQAEQRNGIEKSSIS